MNIDNLLGTSNLVIILLISTSIGYINYWLVYNMYRFDTKGQVYRINIFMIPSLLIMGLYNLNFLTFFASFFITIIISLIWNKFNLKILNIFLKIYSAETYFDGKNAKTIFFEKLPKTKNQGLKIFLNEQLTNINKEKKDYIQLLPNSDFRIDEEGNVTIIEPKKEYKYYIDQIGNINKKGTVTTFIPYYTIKRIELYDLSEI